MELKQVCCFQVLEVLATAARSYENPVLDQRLVVELAGPGGSQAEVDAFWDGGRAWRFRFSPTVPGEWQYRLRCQGPADPGLDGISGAFVAQPYEGDNPLYRHGPVCLSPNRRYLQHADGAPFLWMADTAWNGVLKARPEDWKFYLQRRRQQGFSAVQFVLTQWRAYKQDSQGERAFEDSVRLRVNPAFFQRLDAKVSAVNEAGLLAVPVLLWAIAGEDNPGYTLSEEAAIALARYMVARYGAYQVAWILAGDGDYRGPKASRWQRIGRAVFAGRHDRLVTMHPQGLHWVADEFRGEEWFDFIGYQSGHGDSEQDLRFLVAGPPASEWRIPPPRPIINLEPNYEGHLAYQSRQPFTACHVRRALHWSLLVAPTAGVSYGHHGIWPWMEERGVPPDHPHSGEAIPWSEALESHGASAVGVLVRFFSELPWWQLAPAQELLASQPGEQDLARWAMVAATPRRQLVVAYTPKGEPLQLRASELALPAAASWYDPRSGAWAEAGALEETDQAELTLSPPSEEDWVLCLRSAG